MPTADTLSPPRFAPAIAADLVTTGDLAARYAAWNAIVDHILAPLGGRSTITANTCPCPACAADLAVLMTNDE